MWTWPWLWCFQRWKILGCFHTHMTHSAFCLLQSNLRWRKNLQLQKHSNLSTSPLLHLVLHVFRWISFSFVSFQVLMKPSTKHGFQLERHCGCREDNSRKSSQNPNMQVQTQLFGFSTFKVHTKSAIVSLYSNFLMKNGQQMLPIDNSFSVIDFFFFSEKLYRNNSHYSF